MGRAFSRSSAESSELLTRRTGYRATRRRHTETQVNEGDGFPTVLQVATRSSHSRCPPASGCPCSHAAAQGTTCTGSLPHQIAQSRPDASRTRSTANSETLTPRRCSKTADARLASTIFSAESASASLRPVLLSFYLSDLVYNKLTGFARRPLSLEVEAVHDGERRHGRGRC